MSARVPCHVATFVCVILVAALITPSGAQEVLKAEKNDPAEVMKSVEKLLKDYADENAALKHRVMELEAQVQAMKEKRVVTRVVPQPGVTPQIPPHWKPVPFNGGVYYIVPLSDLQPRPRDANRLPLKAAGELNAGGLIVTPAQPAAPRK